MKIFTVETIPNKQYELLDTVKGTVVQAKHIGKDIIAGIKNLVGGEIEEYSQMLNEARNTATKRMAEEAEKLGADAIIGVRYGSSAVVQGAAEILAYGTAIKFI